MTCFPCKVFIIISLIFIVSSCEDSPNLPVVSRDGKIALCLHEDGTYKVINKSEENTEIFVTDGDGSFLKRLTWHKTYKNWLAWSSDGKKLTFVEDKKSLWVVDEQTLQREELLTIDKGEIWSPCWSPDGKKIAYFVCEKDSEGLFDLYVVDYRTKKAKQILKDTSPPAKWTLDGKQIITLESSLTEQQKGEKIKSYFPGNIKIESGDYLPVNIVTVNLKKGQKQKLASGTIVFLYTLFDLSSSGKELFIFFADKIPDNELIPPLCNNLYRINLETKEKIRLTNFPEDENTFRGMYLSCSSHSDQILYLNVPELDGTSEDKRIKFSITVMSPNGTPREIIKAVDPVEDAHAVVILPIWVGKDRILYNNFRTEEEKPGVFGVLNVFDINEKSTFDLTKKIKEEYPEARGKIEIKVPDDLQKRIDELINQLGADEWKICKKATKELIKIEAPAIPSLKKALKDPDPEVRMRARFILKEFGVPIGKH